MGKNKKRTGILAGTASTMICCVVLLVVVIGGFIVSQNMIQPIGGDVGDGGEQPLYSDPTDTTTDTTTTTTPENLTQYYRLTWGFQWDDLLDPSAKCELTITIHDPDYPLITWGSLTLDKDVGDEALSFYAITTQFADGTRIMVRISNSEGYEFIVYGLTVVSHYNSASPTSMSYPIGYDGLAMPIEVGDYYSTWEAV